MRTSILSRSVIAVASLAIGSVALAAAPANAATPSGITRDMVISAANYMRVEGFDQAASDNLQRLAEKGCKVVAGEDLRIQDINTSAAGGSADGLIFVAGIATPPGESGGEAYRVCLFGTAATTDPALSLSGTASLDVATAPFQSAVKSAALTALSDNVFVTAPVVIPNGVGITTATFSATGNATRSFNVTTTKKVTDKKTKSEKKAAKKKYDKALKAAKKSYTKALKKAGKNKTKKAAAKKTYSKKKAAAKAAYTKAIAGYKMVTTTTTTTENKPFAISAGFDYRD